MRGKDLPRQIRAYVIERLLATGGMGEVYVAHHEFTQLPVALKVMRVIDQEPAAQRARFLREVRAAARIGHSGIIRVYDAGETEDGDLYIAMELLDGKSLEDLFREETDLRTRVLAVAGILPPLQAAHAQGIVHRDLKPANVFVVKDSGLQVKLLDFGIASDEADQRVTQTGMILGTPFYMSPEQAFTPSKVGAASDIWSFGVMLYEALSGRVPFEGETVHSVVMSSSSRPHPPLLSLVPALPQELVAVVDKCLEKHPRDRFSDAGVVRSRLDPILAGASAADTVDAAGAWRTAAGQGDDARSEAIQLSLTPGTDRGPAGRSSVPSLDPDTVAPRAFELSQHRHRSGSRGFFGHGVWLPLAFVAVASASVLYATGNLPVGSGPRPASAPAVGAPVAASAAIQADSEEAAAKGDGQGRDEDGQQNGRGEGASDEPAQTQARHAAREKHRRHRLIRRKPKPRTAGSSSVRGMSAQERSQPLLLAEEDAGEPEGRLPHDYASFVPAPPAPTATGDGGVCPAGSAEDAPAGKRSGAVDEDETRGEPKARLPVQLELPLIEPAADAGAD